MAPVVMHRLRELKSLVELLARRMGGLTTNRTFKSQGR